jgi:hypothetical protein
MADETSETLLHSAAWYVDLESVALLFDHPSFDELVVCTNDAGLLACDEVGSQLDVRDQWKLTGATARVLRSLLSCRRSMRATYLLWCLEQVAAVPAVAGSMCRLPREVGELIARFSLSPTNAATCCSRARTTQLN